MTVSAGSGVSFSVVEPAIYRGREFPSDAVTGDIFVYTAVVPPVEYLYDGGAWVSIGGGGSTGITPSFETYSKNLSAVGSTLNFTGGVLTSIDYDNGVTKTFTYTSGVLTTITLTGIFDPTVLRNKHLNYTSGTLSSISYS